MPELIVEQLAWDKVQGLIPAIIQDASTGDVLMLGYMNKDALQQTLQSNLVTFYSRSKQRLWTKGETSGNQLMLKQIIPDCDNDCLLILATPSGPVCHRNTHTCFDEELTTDWSLIRELEATIKQRDSMRPEGSYTAKLFEQGVSRIAQKVGEEAVEVVIAALENDLQGLCSEMADLFFHLLVLLRSKKLTISDVISVLRKRKV